MPASHPRRNSFPEWFPVEAAAGWRVLDLDAGTERRVAGVELLEGVPVELAGGSRRWRIARE
jgi:hypothetical protein